MFFIDPSLNTLFMVGASCAVTGVIAGLRKHGTESNWFLLVAFFVGLRFLYVLLS